MSGLCVYICTRTHTHTPVYRYVYVLRRPRIPFTCMKICTYMHTHTHTHTYTVHSYTCRGESARHVPSDGVDNAYPTGCTNSQD